MSLTDIELKNLLKDGFIPGPKESETTFLKRVKFLKEFKENPSLPF